MEPPVLLAGSDSTSSLSRAWRDAAKPPALGWRCSDLQVAQHDAAEHQLIAVLQIRLLDAQAVDERAV
jgi:hypothetical protein